MMSDHLSWINMYWNHFHNMLPKLDSSIIIYNLSAQGIKLELYLTYVRYKIYYNSIRKNIAVNNSGSTIENRNIVENNNGIEKYMDPQHRNHTFIDRKQCSLASLRGKPPVE
jgi:hypothetical protein